ncbi:MAG: helix-turn-helix domain-containing protein [Paenibacillaceae bacterium]|nr:helix-turn-helix domain-containing protein [Paenibacillaceae bacterium]
MGISTPETAFLLSHLFALLRLDTVELPGDRSPPPAIPRSEGFLLLAAEGGSAALAVGGTCCRIGAGRCVIAPPGAAIGFAEPADCGGVRVFAVAFSATPVASDPGQTGAPPNFPLLGETMIKPVRKLSALLQELDKHKHGNEDMRRFRNNLLLQELLCLIGEERLAETPSDSAQAVERTIERLQRGEWRDVSVEELARGANVSRRQYTKLFKERIGASPVDYMNGLRIRRAQELLLAAPDNMREVARDAGFRDEYYFSRRFKRIVGVAPGRYLRELRRQPRVVSLHYTGALLACGIVPVGATDTYKRHFPEPLGEAAAVGDYPGYDCRRIAALRPNLIVAPPYLQQDELARLSAIAPVVVPPWWELDAVGQVRHIAGLLDRREEAEAWIARFAARTELTRGRLAPRVRQEQSAAIFQLTGSRLLVYGARNIGHTIYRALGYAPPERVRWRIEADANFNFADISPAALSGLAADRIFLLVGDSAEAREHWRRLQASPVWRGLPAAAEGRVTRIGDKWVPYDPLALDWQLDEAVTLLRSNTAPTLR